MAEKTEQPTGKRKREARQRGQVVHSKEVNTAVGLLVALLLLQGPGKKIVTGISSMLFDIFSQFPLYANDLGKFKDQLTVEAFRIVPNLFLIWILILFTGLVTTFAQTRQLWAKKALGIKFERLNPINGFKRHFSGNGLMEFAKAVLKLIIVGWIAYGYLSGHTTDFIKLAGMGFSSAVTFWVQMIFDLAMQIVFAYVMIGAADYFYNAWNMKRQLMMTKEEVKEEHRQAEGDPMIKSRVRAQMRRMARMRMMANVPKATVVITNPTHLAIAIQYTSEMNAPKVVAKGPYLVAEKIVEVAKANRIPVVQNVPLARALFKMVDVDREIPPDLYTAMAEVLVFVFRKRGPAVGNMVHA